MGILSLINKIAGVISDEINTPKSFKDGQAFENYVREYLFTERYFDLVDMTHNYQTNNRQYVESSLNPDFKFRDRYTNQEFYVEAKFRIDLYQNKLVWCNQHQLNRYWQINQHTPVFLMLGSLGKAGRPDYLSLIPLSKVRYTGLFTSFTDRFEIEPEIAVTSYKLWNR